MSTAGALIYVCIKYKNIKKLVQNYLLIDADLDGKTFNYVCYVLSVTVCTACDNTRYSQRSKNPYTTLVI